MKPILVVLTDVFPTDPIAESFLGNELPFMEARFSEIIFLPASPNDSQWKRSETLSIPVRIIPPALGSVSRIGAILNLIRCAALEPFIFCETIWNECRQRFKIEKGSRVKMLRSALVSTVFVQMQLQYYRRTLLPLLSSDRPVIFYSYWFHHAAYWAGFLGQYFKGKVISRAHGYDGYHFRTGYAPFHLSALKRITHLYCASQAMTNYIKNLYPAYASKTETRHLGTQDFGLQPDTREKAFMVVSCSFVVPVKRIERIINALSIIHDISIHWVHLGEKKVQSLWDELHQYAKTSLPANISFEFKGKLTNAEVMTYYSTHHVDLFANVSESEGLPVTLMEAASFGIPVAGTSVGGIPEFIQDGGNGFLLDADKPEASLAAVIRRVNAMPENEYIGLRRQSRLNWKTHYSANEVYRAFYAELDSFSSAR